MPPSDSDLYIILLMCLCYVVIYIVPVIIWSRLLFTVRRATRIIPHEWLHLSWRSIQEGYKHTVDRPMPGDAAHGEWVLC